MNTKPDPQAIATDLAQIDQLRAIIAEERWNDLQLRIDTIEGQTQALEHLDELADQIIADQERIKVGTERLDRIELRAKKLRSLALQLMEKIGKKVERPLYTASVAAGQPTVHISLENEHLIPEEFIRVVPDKTAIAKALKQGKEVPGATLNNVPPVLRIYPK
jgi:tetrahydromethanopterin S-methyltransferase subunit G